MILELRGYITAKNFKHTLFKWKVEALIVLEKHGAFKKNDRKRKCLKLTSQKGQC